MSLNFEKPWVILCESPADQEIFARLVSLAGLEDNFQVVNPSSRDNPGRGGGRGGFGSLLSSAYKLNELFREKVKAVLIISDNDDDPIKSFDEVKAEIEKAKFGVPAAPKTVARKIGFPDVVVLMIPDGKHGSLETFCIDAAYEKWSIEKPLNEFVEATPTRDWPPSKQRKMRMQCILSATCKPNPGAGLAHHWREGKDYHIPLENAAFSELSGFLKGFETLLKA